MSDRMDTEALEALRKAASEATGDQARFPRRGIIDRYHGAVLAAYEAGDLAPATEVLELRADPSSGQRIKAAAQEALNYARGDQSKAVLHRPAGGPHDR